MTLHKDDSVKFLDVSVQLLLPTTPSDFQAFPRTMPWLEIRPNVLLRHPSVDSHIPLEVTKRMAVQAISFAEETSEVTIIFNTGHVIVYRLTSTEYNIHHQLVLDDSDLVSLEHIFMGDGLAFRPFFMVLPPATVSAYSHSEIGRPSSS